jgi:hypothetical protein
LALCLTLSTEPAQAREQLLKNVLGQGGWSTRFLVLTPEYLYFFKDTPKKARAAQP